MTQSNKIFVILNLECVKIAQLIVKFAILELLVRLAKLIIHGLKLRKNACQVYAILLIISTTLMGINLSSIIYLKIFLEFVQSAQIIV